MSNFTQRLITAAIAGTISIAAIVWSHYGLMIFCILVSLLGVWEFMALVDEPRKYRWMTLAFGVTIWVLTLLRDLYPPLPAAEMLQLPAFERTLRGANWLECFFGLALLVTPVGAILALYDKAEKLATQTLGNVTFSLAYCLVPLWLLQDSGLVPFTAFNGGAASVVQHTYVFEIPLCVLMLNWFLDSFAYIGGRAFGKHPLFPRISPKKTWEGSLFGVACCLLLGGIFLHFNIAGVNWLGVAVIVCVLSQLGDLVESMFKRNAHLKDSGSILPGHGGMLDRFDGLYISMPVVYLYLLMP